MKPLNGSERHCPVARRPGFTMIEVLIVLLIGGIMMAIAIPQSGKFLSKRAAANARDAFVFSAARARAAAVERGDVVVMVVRPAGDSVTVMSADAADTLHVLDLRGGETKADLLAEAVLRVCYMPRGFAHPSCGSGSSLPKAVGFAGKQDTLWSVLNAVGQVQRQ